MDSVQVNANTVVQRSDDLLFSDLDNETVMMDIEKGDYYGLDDIGSRIWTLAENPISVGEICAKLGEEYAVDADTCAADVLPFIDKLLEHKVFLPISHS